MIRLASIHSPEIDMNGAACSRMASAEGAPSRCRVSDADRRMLEDDLSALQTVQGVAFKWQEPLSSHTTFRVGGPISCLAEPLSEDALLALMARIRELTLPCFILGGGSNILAPDTPWHAVSISLRSCSARVAGAGPAIYAAGAGLRLSGWLRFCAANGLAGMEFLTGIPGTIGGALVMNAGTREGSIAESLVWIDILDGQGRRHRLQRKDLQPGYRSMGLQKDWTVLGASFRLRQSTPQAVRDTLRQFMVRRKQTQPLGLPSAGCIFKNPEGFSAGALIDKAGLKGMRIGDAEISEKHANWIVNRGEAKARDIRALIRYVQAEVHRRFGIPLELEIQVFSNPAEETAE